MAQDHQQRLLATILAADVFGYSRLMADDEEYTLRTLKAYRVIVDRLINGHEGRIFHTYSQYARGLEATGGSYYFLDLTALGRQEEWEEPKGRAGDPRSATPDFAA